MFDAQMSSLEEWITEIVTEAEQHIKESRDDTSLFFSVAQDALLDSFYIYRDRGEDRLENIRGRPVYIIAPSEIERVTPQEISFRFRGDWALWHSDPSTFVNYSEIWRKTIGTEKKKIIELLSVGIENVEISSTFEGLDTAERMITPHGRHPLILLVSYSQLGNLIKLNSFRHSSHFPPAFNERHGKNFAGIIGGLTVKYHLGLAQNEALLYDWSSAHLKFTPLEVQFDSIENPRMISVREYLYAWFDRDNSAVKLTILNES